MRVRVHEAGQYGDRSIVGGAWRSALGAVKRWRDLRDRADAYDPSVIQRDPAVANRGLRDGQYPCGAMHLDHGRSGLLSPQPLLPGAPRRVTIDLRRAARVAFRACDGELQHPRDGTRPEHRIAKDLVVHVPSLRRKAGVLDVAHDLNLVHAVARAGCTHDVLLDHDAAHVVGAVGEAQLTDFAALRHPRRLQVVEVVEHYPGDGERPEVLDAGRLPATELGMLRL